MADEAMCGMRDFWCMADADTICADDICCIDCSAFSRCDWSMYDAGLPLDGTCKRNGMLHAGLGSCKLVLPGYY